MSDYDAERGLEAAWGPSYSGASRDPRVLQNVQETKPITLVMRVTTLENELNELRGQVASGLKELMARLAQLENKVG